MNDDRLSNLLKSTGRLTMLAEGLRATLATAGVLVLAALMALVIDAVLALDSWALIVIDLMLVSLVAAAALFVGWHLYRNWFDPRRIARLIEQRLGIRDNRLINAVELAHARRGQVSAELLRRSIEEGEELAARLTPKAVLDLRPLAKAGLAAGAAMLLVLCSYLTAPRLFSSVLTRLFDPTGDHPPYTLFQFAVTVSPETVYVGQSATITVELTGADLPQQASLIFTDDEHRKPQPMLRGADGKFTLTIDRVEATREFFIDTPKGRSARQLLTVSPVPLIESAEVRYNFPDYTDWQSATHSLSVRGMHAIEGTEIVVTVKSNLPLSSGSMELIPEAKTDASEAAVPSAVQVPLKPNRADPTTAVGSFTLQFGGTYKLSITGASGAPGKDILEGKIIATPDRLPQVEIVTPEPQVVAVEDWKIPVVVQASDDVSISRIALSLSVNGWGPTPTELSPQWNERNVASAAYEFDLKSLGARAGDILSYYATAHDNHPGDGQFVDTPTYVIQVISLQEYLEFARTQYRMEEITAELQAFEKQLDGLKSKREKLLEELEGLKKKLQEQGELSPAEMQKMEGLQQSLDDYSKQAEKLAKEMADRAKQPQLYEFEEAYQQMLEKLAEQLKQQQAGADAVSQQSQGLRKQPQNAQQRQELQQAIDKFAAQKEPFDQQSEQGLDQVEHDLQRMKLADDLLAQAERVNAVVQQQRELADRMAQYRNQDQLSPQDQQRAQRLAKEQDLLRQELEEAAKDLEQAAKAAEKDLPKTSADAMKLCKSIGEMQIPSDQGTAAKQARSGSGSKAHESAETAAKKLESLQGDCNCESAGEEIGDLDGGLKLTKPQAKNSLKQLSQGRTIPGIGQKPGQKPGQQGSGTGGTEARMVVMGPHIPTGKDSEAKSGRGREGPGGRVISGLANDPNGAETLDPGQQSGRGSTAGNMRGVPVGYRDQAEAYFKRLAEER